MKLFYVYEQDYDVVCEYCLISEDRLMDYATFLAESRKQRSNIPFEYTVEIRPTQILIFPKYNNPSIKDADGVFGVSLIEIKLEEINVFRA